MTTISFTTSEVLVLSIFVLFAGKSLVDRIKLLNTLQLPPAVVGGLLCSVIFTGITLLFNIKFEFDFALRGPLLLIFFSSVGMLAKLTDIKKGGRTFAILAVITVIFLFLQNVVGVSIVQMFGYDPEYGLIAGSISLAGGHGTALSWGEFLGDAGVNRAMEVGVAFATLGLIAGGLVGGPLATYLLTKVKEKPSATADDVEVTAQVNDVHLDPSTMINAILFFAICASAGAWINGFMSDHHVVLPGFVTALIVGVFIGNLSRWKGFNVEFGVIEKLGSVALSLFLAMSLMTLDLIGLAGYLGQLILLIAAQTVLVVAIAVLLIFKFTGRNYDSVVMSAGFCGIGLGATPVGVANMSSVCDHHGPSPQSFIVIPLLGAGLLDIVNAIVIQLWLQWII